MPALALAPDVEHRRLLKAGHRVLTRDGYDGLKVETVLAEADLSTRAFYRHFDGKTGLFLALFTDEAARSSAALTRAVGAVADPRGQVRAWIEAVLALGFDRRLAGRARGFMAERALLEREHPEAIAACLAEQRRPLVDAIRNGVTARVFRSVDPEADAVALHHLCQGLFGDALAGTGHLDAAGAIALAQRFAFAALETP